MSIPSYLKRLTATRLRSGRVVRFVVVILRKRIAMTRLQKMAANLQIKYFGGDKAANLNDHHEFSCSSSLSTNSSIYGHGVNSGCGRNNLYGHFLLRALLPSCTCLNVEDELDSKSGTDAAISEFIACDEDDDHHFSDKDSHFSANSNSNQSSSASCTYVSAARSSNCCLQAEIDRQAEEFIATFYKQMRLQRQDSYVKCQEMLARGSS